MNELDAYRRTTLFQVDETGQLFISPAIRGWEPINERGINVVVDLEGDIDHGVPTLPNSILYLYFPIHDEELPNLAKLHAIAELGASLITSGHRVLSHCGMGFNRSALVAGLVMNKLGMPGPEVVTTIRKKRTGALFNENFARFLEEL
ncbi:MAG: dual specificity protein phosphatase family protein [Thermoanaerobaculia bacterium]|nr:dual specificity protein phosphatase family protein [Thermoanaerobaculia bacterium]